MRLLTFVRASVLFLMFGLLLAASSVRAQSLPPATADDQMGM